MDFVGASPTTCTKDSWKGSLTGKAVVPKTTALVACRFDSCPFLQFVEASPNGMAAVC